MLARATFVSLSSVFLDVPLAWLPSAMFCTPLRAACTSCAGCWTLQRPL